VFIQGLLFASGYQSCLNLFRFLVQEVISVMSLHGSSVVVSLPGFLSCDEKQKQLKTPLI